MDSIYALVGGGVIAWVGAMFINKYAAAVIAYVIVIVILMYLPSGIVPITLITGLAGVVIGVLLSKKQPKK